MRLNRYLAAAGLGSRRSCEALIVAGRVSLNGRACTALATTVGATDAVKVDGRLIRAEAPVYVLLNKPVGFLSTRTDPRQRDTVFDLLPADFPRVFHVGRLDRDSEGLLLLTNDGEFALRLTHPRYKVEKEYEVALDRPFDLAEAGRLQQGVFIRMDNEDGQPPTRVRARAEEIHRIGPNKLKVILRQGLKRQIRLMFLALGYEVMELRRVRVGPLRLGRLRSGEWRHLEPREIAWLQGDAPAEKAAPRQSAAPPSGANSAPSSKAPMRRRAERRPLSERGDASARRPPASRRAR